MASVALTLNEAAGLLQPPLTGKQLRQVIRALHIQPAGYRHDGRPGHPTAIYPWDQIVALHAALTPWLASANPADGVT